MRGVFITGTDTEVGKTYVASAVARTLRQNDVQLGVYKPVASGCRLEEGQLVSHDAQMLWDAAGQPGELHDVCPQRFAAPLAPHVAAAAEEKSVDEAQLIHGLQVWKAYDFVLVEGAGGLLSPLSPSLLNADVAKEFGLPLIVVAANRLGVINHTLLTLNAAQSRGLKVSGVILSDVMECSDESSASNRAELEALCLSQFSVALLGHVLHGQQVFEPALQLAN